MPERPLVGHDLKKYAEAVKESLLPVIELDGSQLTFSALDINSEDAKLAGVESTTIDLSVLSAEDRDVLLAAVEMMREKGFDSLNIYLYVEDRISETKRHEAKKKESAHSRLEELFQREEKLLEEFFGQPVFVRPIPDEITVGRLEAWEKQGFELHYLPAIDMTKDKEFPGWRKKPSDWFYAEIAAGNVSQIATDLPGLWVLIDGRPLPDALDRTYIDDPFQETLSRLRAQRVLPAADPNALGSRFGISAQQLMAPSVRSALAAVLNVLPEQLTYPRVIEFNLIGNIHHPEWALTSAVEWFLDEHLHGRLYGGLEHVSNMRGDLRGERLGFRPLVLFK